MWAGGTSFGTETLHFTQLLISVVKCVLMRTPMFKVFRENTE